TRDSRTASSTSACRPLRPRSSGSVRGSGGASARPRDAAGPVATGQGLPRNAARPPSRRAVRARHGALALLLSLRPRPRHCRPALALTTIGRRSGRLHTVALAYYDIDGAWAVVGSAGGSETEPQWVANLRADPVAWVHLHRRSTPVLAEVLDGEAKRPIWDTI